MHQLDNRYFLDEVIGRGRLGEVWRAHDGEGRPFAIRVLNDELAQDPDVVARFVRERTLLVQLTSAHLVQVHDHVADGGTLAVVMELVDGPDLRSELARGTLPPADALDVCASVCRGLAVVHGRGLVHGDIKPANVLLAGNSGQSAKLTDFGVAWLSGDAELGSTPVGTPEYMAPEYRLGMPITSAADMYAVGIVLYELVCGVTPFAGGSPSAVLDRHVSRTATQPAGMSDQLWQLVERLLSKEPTERPTATVAAVAMQQLADELADLPAVAPLAEPPATLPADLPPVSAAALAGSAMAAQALSLGAAAGPAAGGRLAGKTAMRTEFLPPPDPRHPLRRQRLIFAAAVLVLLVGGAGLAVAVSGKSTTSGADFIPPTPSTTSSSTTSTDAPETGTTRTSTVPKEPGADPSGEQTVLVMETVTGVETTTVIVETQAADGSVTRRTESVVTRPASSGSKTTTATRPNATSGTSTSTPTTNQPSSGTSTGSSSTGTSTSTETTSSTSPESSSSTSSSTESSSSSSSSSETTTEPPPVVTSPLTANAIKGEPFEFSLTATGSGPLTWSALNLPTWMQLDADNVLRAVVVPDVDAALAVVDVTDQFGQRVVAAITITVSLPPPPEITNSGRTVTATVGELLWYTFATNSEPYSLTWSIVEGAMDGLSISPEGWLIISQFPSAGEFDFTVRATDAYGQFAEGSIHVVAEEPPSPYDINDDGAVDCADLAIVVANLGGPGGPSQGDVNGDGMVDQADYDAVGGVVGIC